MSSQLQRFAERIQSRARRLVKRTVFGIYRMGCKRCDVSELVFFLPVRSRHEFEIFETCLKEAVWIINRFDPVRLQRIQRDLSNGIVVVPSTSGAHYLPDIGVCILNSRRLLEGSHLSTALAIVHEAAHARLRCVPNPTPEQRARIERICIGAQIAFVSRLPENQRALENLRRMQAETVARSFEGRIHAHGRR